MLVVRTDTVQQCENGAMLFYTYLKLEKKNWIVGDVIQNDFILCFPVYPFQPVLPHISRCGVLCAINNIIISCSSNITPFIHTFTCTYTFRFSNAKKIYYCYVFVVRGDIYASPNM